MSTQEEENIKDEKIDTEDIEEFLKCDVCKDILNDPRTLLCQHTFCATCLISLKECPMCRLKLYLPEKSNDTFNKLIGLIYGPEKIKELEDRHRKEKIEKEMLPKVIDELNNNLNNTVKTSVNNNTDDSVNVIDPVFSLFGLEMKLSTFDYILKFIEITFLLYYLYTFYLSYTSGSLTTYKIFINLLVIFQSAYSIFTPKTQSTMGFSLY
jgi:hypothetical protein